MLISDLPKSKGKSTECASAARTEPKHCNMHNSNLANTPAPHIADIQIEGMLASSATSLSFNPMDPLIFAQVDVGQHMVPNHAARDRFALHFPHHEVIV